MRLRPYYLAWLLCAPAAFAQESQADKVTARARFQEGLAHARAGEVAAALRSFELAYASSPHYSVLYNIGQAQSALERPVEAIASFERYLAEGSGQIDGARREQVQALLKAERQRVGMLELRAAEPAKVRVWLDGSELRPDQLNQPIPLKAGKHQLLHASGSGYPTSRDIEVPPGDRLTLEVSAAEATTHTGQLAIVCSVPGVAVVLDGRTLAHTPVVRPLLVPVGTHLVRLSRAGYRTVERAVSISPTELSSLRCSERPEATLAPTPVPGRELAAARSSRRLVGYALGGTGVALLAVGGGVYGWNLARYDDWRQGTDHRDLNRVASIQRADDLALGLALAGSGFVAASIWTLLTEP